MSDYISRQAAQKVADDCSDEHRYAKDSIWREAYNPYHEGWTDACDTIFARLESIPPADVRPTKHILDDVVYGYKIRDILLFADACRMAGVTNHELKSFVNSMDRAYEIIAKNIDKQITNSLSKYLRPRGDFE